MVKDAMSRPNSTKIARGEVVVVVSKDLDMVN
jgi:hypothetical protein